MGVTWIDPVDIVPTTLSSWVDTDLSAYVPSGATGVILHISMGSGPNYGYRKNGSTDDRHTYAYGNLHFWATCGVDANRIIEQYINESDADNHVYLVGYFDDDAVFHTNATNISLGSTGAWTDIDIGADDGAIGAMIEVYYVNSVATFGLRKNGSTDDRYALTSYQNFGIIGVNEDILEGYISSTSVDFYLRGYIKSGATFNTNAADLSLGSTGSYADLTALPSGATGGFIEVVSSSTYNYALRKNGSTEDVYKYVINHEWAAVECDESQLIEGKISNVGADFFLVGYTEAATSFSSITAIKVWNGVEWIAVP